MDCSSSSWPVSSPSRTMIFSGWPMATAGYSGGGGLGAVERQLGRALLERRDHEREVLVEVDAERLGAVAQLVAVDRRGEGRRLHLLLDRLGRHAVDALRAHVGARHKEPAQLVDGEQRLLHRALARDAEEVRVGGDRAHELLREAALLEFRERDPRM